MTRLWFIFVLLLILAGGAGFILLGAFPQHLARTPVEHSIPADRLGHS